MIPHISMNTLAVVFLASIVIGGAWAKLESGSIRLVQKAHPTAVSYAKDKLPYDATKGWGSGRSHEEVAMMYRTLFGPNMGNASGVYSVYPASQGGGSKTAPADIQEFLVETTVSWQGYDVLGHLFVLSNPIGRFTAEQPGNMSGQGCDKRTRMTTTATSAYHKCRVATNAGFFNPDTNSPFNGECLGNLVVRGQPVRYPGTQNANFGLLKNGSYVTGYIPPSLVAHPDPKNPSQLISEFDTLIAGVVLLVKDGVNFVQQSALLENSSTQTSGSIQYFIDIVTARTAIGHDKFGNLLLFTSDGHTGSNRGIDLNDMANLMIQFGAINAINLDGGGSSTSSKDNILINMPTDNCPGLNPMFHCERAVSSIICLKDPVTMPQSPTTQSTPEAPPAPTNPPPPVSVPISPPVSIPPPPTTPVAPPPQSPPPSPVTQHPVGQPVQAPLPSPSPTASPVPAITPVSAVPETTPPTSVAPSPVTSSPESPTTLHNPASPGTCVCPPLVADNTLRGPWKSVLILCVVVNVLSIAGVVALVLYMIRHRKQTSNPYQRLTTEIN